MVRTSLSRPVLARICLVRYTSEQRAETNQKGENVQRGGILADKDAQAKAGCLIEGGERIFGLAVSLLHCESLFLLFSSFSLSSPLLVTQDNTTRHEYTLPEPTREISIV